MHTHVSKRRVILLLAGLLLILTGCAGDADERPVAVPAQPDLTPAPITAGARLMPGTTWHWQLTSEIDLSLDVALYDIDLFDTPQYVIEELHNAGRIVICYFSAGSWEDWRPDAGDFPEEVIGHALQGWPGEYWLDVRQLDLLGPVMAARLDLAVEQGCDGVEPDNVDGYTYDSGFPLTYDDQLAYNIWLAEEAHARGLLILLKNDLEQVGDLLSFFDGALNEQCFQYEECELLLPFIAAGKPVFGVEYEGELQDFCPQANAWNFSWLLKNWELDAWSQPCW